MSPIAPLAPPASRLEQARRSHCVEVRVRGLGAVPCARKGGCLARRAAGGERKAALPKFSELAAAAPPPVRLARARARALLQQLLLLLLR